MSRNDAILQYENALKLGLKYSKEAIAAGRYPYPLVLDEILDESRLAARENVGTVNIPCERIVGTRSAGRTAALAGNFMPLLSMDSEFATKWINLCEAHLSDEGIRDPIKCFEYMGRFYVQEGNKRTSVLMSYGARDIPANVIRLIPEYHDSPEIAAYYEFVRFYHLAGSYDVFFRRAGDYEKLLARLGYSQDHIWTEWERRSFHAGLIRFTDAFRKVSPVREAYAVSEALLAWLQLFTFQDIKDLGTGELEKKLIALLPDVNAASEETPIELNTRTLETNQAGVGLLGRLFGRPALVKAAFIYAFEPEKSSWTYAHELGRQYAEKQLGDRVRTGTYLCRGRSFDEVMEEAVAEGYTVIFATTPQMVGACRRMAAKYPQVHIFNCALDHPYSGVQQYYSRMYESRFITGAIAGAMAENGKIGYIANYPVLGTPASINAFALGVRMTNPRATVRLAWSCTAGDHVKEFISEGISVISNREASDAAHAHWSMEWGLYKIGSDNDNMPLAMPCWNWGNFYEKVLHILANGYKPESGVRQPILWWGMDSGVIDVQLSETLPFGVHSLAEILREGLIKGTIDPFRSKIFDQQGILRSDGSNGLQPETLMNMNWLCDNIDGTIPPYYVILPQSRAMTRQLGIYRDELPVEDTEEKQR